jgi:ADP-ribose pyrophosphatase
MSKDRKPRSEPPVPPPPAAPSTSATEPPGRSHDSSQPAYRGYFIEVISEEVELPNGHTVGLDIIRHPGAAAVVPFLSPSEVLLIRQYRYATGGTLYEVPAGKIDAGESPEICAARELEEETGWRAGRLEPLGAIWTTPGFTDERIYLFAAHDLVQTRQQLQKDEIIELVPTPLDDALALVWSGQLSDAKSALALIYAARVAGQLR